MPIAAQQMLLASLWLVLSPFALAADGDQPKLPLAFERLTPGRDCVELLPKSASDQFAWLLDAGRFCLMQDFRQHELRGAGHSWPGPDHALLTLYGGDIDLDLQGHTLFADARSNGIQAHVAMNAEHARGAGKSFGTSTNRIRIHNGYIDLRALGTGAGIKLLDKWESPAASIDKPAPDGRVEYQKTQYLLENLVIRTSGVGIQLEGDGNVIRNCIIESEGNATVVLVGPNGLLQDNKLVLRNRWWPTEIASSSDFFLALKQLGSSRARPRAVVVLRQASGTRVVGNSIEIEGASDRRRAIHVKDGSKDVLLQGNRFLGTKTPVVVEPASAVIERNNEVSER